MSQDVAERVSAPQAARTRWPVLAVACAAALVFGIVLPIAPKAAIAAVVLVPLAFAAPVAALSVLLAVTILVPFDVQDALAVVGGSNQPGLLAVDVLMLLGLIRVAWLVVRGRLPIDRRLVAGLVLTVIVAVALVWGLALGAETSAAGHEARRVLLGCGTFLMTLPLVDDAAARKRLSWALMAIGGALALWGLAQWVFSVGYSVSAGDVGVRPGVDLTTSGHGQLQGGMYAYPVAIILSWAALLSGKAITRRVQLALMTILLLNGVCLILTFERSLWGAAAAGCVVVALMSGAAARRNGLKWAAGGVIALILVAAVAPGQARTAVERLFSITRVSTDTSFTSRVVESRAVIDAIGQRPLTGSGFGATITWGQRDMFATTTTPFVHNGYFWLAWKIGIPAAVFVVALLAAAVVRRSRVADDSQWRALRRGSQASLFALLLVCVVFPVFNVLGITAAMGFLAAVCCSREPT
jgi:O-antigen ligase